MYAKNVAAFLALITKDGSIAVDDEDEIVRETLVTTGGEIVNGRVLRALQEVRDV
jgi:NAD(P) transhydrogenase subunit alpha